MTSELRPAMEVADDCYEQEFFGIEAAAAVIEADREAVRAPLLAEIERLRERLEIDPAHSIDGIYARDETIRGLDAELLKLKARDIGWSMQFEEQADELAKFKALAETLAGAAEALKEDMLLRARMKQARNGGDLVVEAGNGVWFRFNEALRQYKEARDAS